MEHVNRLHPLDVETRLEELANLKDQWMDGKGVALDGSKLKALSEEFDKNFNAALPLPHLYPTPEGAVLAEWTLGQWAVSLEIEITTRTAQYEALNLTSDEAIELILNLNEPSGWTSLNNQLQLLVKENYHGTQTIYPLRRWRMREWFRYVVLSTCEVRVQCRGILMATRILYACQRCGAEWGDGEGSRNNRCPECGGHGDPIGECPEDEEQS